jgi:hypothetical protein
MGEVLDASTTVALQLLDANTTVALLTDQLLVATNKAADARTEYALATLADANMKSEFVARLQTANDALETANVNRALVDIQLKEVKAKFTAAEIVLAVANVCHNTACTTGLPVRHRCAALHANLASTAPWIANMRTGMHPIMRCVLYLRGAASR